MSGHIHNVSEQPNTLTVWEGDSHTGDLTYYLKKKKGRRDICFKFSFFSWRWCPWTQRRCTSCGLTVQRRRRTAAFVLFPPCRPVFKVAQKVPNPKSDRRTRQTAACGKVRSSSIKILLMYHPPRCGSKVLVTITITSPHEHSNGQEKKKFPSQLIRLQSSLFFPCAT